MLISGVTLSKIIGSTNQPPVSVNVALPPDTRRAPSAFAFSM